MLRVWSQTGPRDCLEEGTGILKLDEGRLLPALERRDPEMSEECRGLRFTVLWVPDVSSKLLASRCGRCHQKFRVKGLGLRV